MILYLHEMKRGRLALIIWSLAISFLVAVCVLIYPEMESQMADMSEMFADMGAFSEAFGLDEMGFGSFMGYFSVECGEMLGIGGACFAAIMGIGALSGEESAKTAEFLLTHPIPRKRVVFSKLLAVLSSLLMLNLVVGFFCALSILAVGVEADFWQVTLLILSYFLLQTEIALMCFGISSLLRRRGIGIGLGLAMGFYFLSIISKITEKTEFLRYLTPFSYTDGAYIVDNSALEWGPVAVGAAVGAAFAVLAFVCYERKDIR